MWIYKSNIDISILITLSIMQHKTRQSSRVSAREYQQRHYWHSSEHSGGGGGEYCMVGGDRTPVWNPTVWLGAHMEPHYMVVAGPFVWLWGSLCGAPFTVGVGVRPQPLYGGVCMEFVYNLSVWIIIG